MERKIQNGAMQLAFEPSYLFYEEAPLHRNNAHSVSVIDNLYLSHRQVMYEMPLVQTLSLLEVNAKPLG